VRYEWEEGKIEQINKSTLGSHLSSRRLYSRIGTASFFRTASMTRPRKYAGTQLGARELNLRAQPCSWLCTLIERTIMAKKSSASSQPARLKSMTSGDIKNKKWSKKELEAVRRITERQAAGDDSQIDFSDIPRLTEEQLASMVRLREARQPKVSVSLRLDPRVLAWLKSRGSGHLTRINDILANLMEAEQRTGR
jgi:uncharacterized protein (DUF4415 family)